MIRKMKIEDINEIMKIWLDTNLKAHYFISESYWKNNYSKVKEGILSAKVYVYEVKGQVVGFIGIIDGYIAGIFVKESMQHQGIGKKLINKCKVKYEELTLSVYEKNNLAINFYKAEGFNIESKKIDKYTNEKELIMKWTKL